MTVEDDPHIRPLSHKVGFHTAVAARELARHVRDHPLFLDIRSRFDDDRIAQYLQFKMRQYAPLREGPDPLPPAGVRIREHSATWWQGLRSELKSLKSRCVRYWNRRWSGLRPAARSDRPAVIAVHYCEGVDLRRRSDIVWLPPSGIPADRVLVYLDYNGAQKRWPVFSTIPADLRERLEDAGLPWAFLPRENPTALRGRTWSPRGTAPLDRPAPPQAGPTDAVEKFIIRTARELTAEVDYWREFFLSFNVRLLFLPNEGDPSIIAQVMAMDSLGDRGGLVLGKLRSDFGDTPEAVTGYYTRHVFFTWSERYQDYFLPPFNSVGTQVVAGHPDDHIFSSTVDSLKSLRADMESRGASFLIALLDTGHDPDPKAAVFSSADLEEFYRVFLEWVMTDPSVGIVIKSKKAHVIERLPGIHSLLASAEATGRCHNLKGPLGRHPSDASKISDFAVGCGVSSALTEAVIAGCRGVHYHKHFPQDHDYFDWDRKSGRERLVFTDLAKLKTAIGGYRDDPAAWPGLGDWTSHLPSLDPFRDGKAAQRMGTYLRWCLEGFDKGLGRDEVLSSVNERYAAEWGEDKILKPLDKPKA
ncbi:hypothetical protein ACFL2T_05585 [Elusimicrobiota bacterium]